ncbi:hypothetical protein J6590_028279 [Homalodisca vitripennis]|nr:hypothetical protein J6590_028279 [Homalodisca vitripennis]
MGSPFNRFPTVGETCGRAGNLWKGGKLEVADYSGLHCCQCSGNNSYHEITESKQRRAWLLLTAERSCPCKQPACPAIGDGSEVTFKLLVPRSSLEEAF